MTPLADRLTRLAEHLASRRGELLRAWREAVHRDPAMTTSDAMPRSELNDHIPALLSAFERELGHSAASARKAAAGEHLDNAAAHGLHRWQQGYDLREVTRELGRLNECMCVELDRYALAHPELESDVMPTARQRWAAACTVAMGESASQYFKLQQLEASGHVKDLEQALEAIRELEQQRAELWQQAAHDLRGNLGVVANATAGLTLAGVPETARETFLRMLQRNVSSLHHLLDDVTSLARLQAGRESRSISRIDVAQLLSDLCEGLRPLAEQRNLYLVTEGPATFFVEGDVVKTRRLAQNLVLNSIKYTVNGGVTVQWGDSVDADDKRWALSVRDTGPGFHAGPGAPLFGALEEATHLTRENVSDAQHPGAFAAQMPGSSTSQSDRRPVHQGAGEGIGLSIVKRLCDLLDATIELESSEAHGTTFRILLPRTYLVPAGSPPGAFSR